ncbi:MAG: SGNH/GDSL hydrolase family protein [Proteobacteria bacterium]|nr:SGNH/GDSL hydrolase family protein [Pseudomonadota bacterium]
MGKSSKIFIYSIIACCLSLMATLLLGEFLVRFLSPQDLQTYSPWYTSHPIYRFQHSAGINTIKKWGNPYRLRTNSKGARSDREIAYNKKALFRVVLLGDSMVFGNGVDQEDTFASVAQTLLRSGGRPDSEVVNLGVSAFGPDLETLFYEYEARKYAADIVLIGVCLANDIADLSRSQAIFSLTETTLKPQSYSPSKLKRLTENNVYRSIATHSHLLIFLRNFYTENFERSVRGTGEFSPEAQVADIDQNVRIYNLILKRLIKDIRQDNAIPMFLLFPTPGQVARAQGRNIPDPYLKHADLNAKVLQKHCKDLKVKCLDPLLLFNQYAGQVTDLFIPNDFHLSRIGHSLVAKLLAEQLFLSAER